MQEVLTGARLVKRMAFALFSGETDQYVSFLPDIQGEALGGIENRREEERRERARERDGREEVRKIS